MEYNLLDEEWIPVLYGNGGWERVGIRKALQDAGRIRQIVASNPMDNVALLRFLLAVLVWCRGELTENDRKLLEADADGIPQDWLKKLDKCKEKFNLLGDGERFFQDPSLRGHEGRPIGDLLVEFPTETKIAHFRHVRDKEYGLCLACCALGIVRFCAFANYAGSGYTSGINGPAPAYGIAQGMTLLATLRLHWPANNTSRREPPWLCADAPSTNDLDIVTVFAWRSRRMWLSDPAEKGICAYCGERDVLIRGLANTGGWEPPFTAKGKAKKFWDRDPHLILVRTDPGAEDEAAEDKDNSLPQARPERIASTITALSFPRPGRRVLAHAGFWRRVLVALRKQPDGTDTVVVAGPAASQTGMLYQDAAAIRLPCRAADNSTVTSLEIIGGAMEGLSGILRSSTPNPQRQHPERKAALDALSPSLETCLRQELSVCQEPQDLRDRLQPVVRHIVSATTVGSPFCRREAMRCADSALDAALGKIASNREDTISADDNPQVAGAKAAKPKRRRKKRETGT